MCGLCGVYGDVDFDAKQALYHLMLFSQLRGVDSTGIAVVPKDVKKPPEIYKALGGVESLAASYPKVVDFKRRTIDEFGLLAILSHHRAATVGGVTKDNAHPFMFDNIVGTHNGTIPHHIHSKLSNKSFSSTDSEKCLAHIDKFDDPTDAFKKISGEYAFVWFDSRDDTICLARNDRRPLYTARTLDGKTMFYASEAWMLHVALDRVGIKWGNMVDGKLQKLAHVVTPGMVHRIGRDENDKVIVYSSDKVKPYEAPVYTPPAVVSTNYKQRGGSQGASNVVNLINQNQNTEVGTGPGKETFIEDYVTTTHGTMVHKVRWMGLVKDGCSMCSADLSWEDRKSVKWVDSTTPLCESCGEKHEKEAKAN